MMVVDQNSGRAILNPINGPYNFEPLKDREFFWFDTRDSIQRQRMMDFVENVIPDGAYVGLLAFNTPSDAMGYGPHVWANDSITQGKNLFQVLENQGAKSVRQLVNFSVAPPAYGFVFRKNHPEYPAKDTIVYSIDATAEVRASFRRLCGQCDLVLVEGAGSPAEINLRAGDIANMGFAEAENLPVVLVGDIERGGVIASFAGTFAVLEAGERARIVGTIVNKFRGDIALFDDGRKAIEEWTARPCLGVVPWFAAASDLPAEDSAGLAQRYARKHGAKIKIRVPHGPHIANFDDLDPLAALPEIDLALLEPGEALPGDCDIVLLPGSKATIADLAFLRAQGWDIDIAAHRRRGGIVVGLCGGYQMMGRTIADPDGLEGPPAIVAGLGLLDVESVLAPAKTLREIDAIDARSGCRIRGYEIHLGVTTGSAPAFLELGGVPAGAVSTDGRAMGCYIHGLFGNAEFSKAWFARLDAAIAMPEDAHAAIERTLDALASHLETCLDLDRLLEFARCG
jgi:adenosylcobyric acid synthase